MDIRNNKCENEFTFKKTLGVGGFGVVMMMLSNIDNNDYAVKKIPFDKDEKDEVLKETEIARKLNSSYIVKVHDSWCEENYYRNYKDNDPFLINCGFSGLPGNYKQYLLHIKMELCPLTLYDVLSQITPSKTIGYFILSEILVEILECLLYLHSNKPQPIVHGDLSPKNILLTTQKPGRIIRLGDFGLSRVLDPSENSSSSMSNSRSYRAPEYYVYFAKQRKQDIYDNFYKGRKLDICSLGSIIIEMFNMNLPEKRDNQTQHFKNLKLEARKMVHKIISERPSCKKIVEDKSNWILTDQDIKDDKQIIDLYCKTPQSNNIIDKFDEYFLQNNSRLIQLFTK